MRIKSVIKRIIPNFLIGAYHFTLALLSALYYRFPSKRIIVIGITGTHGKTTVVDLSARILESAGYKIAVASSIKFKIGDYEEENKLKMTMPGRGYLQRFLRKAVKAKCKYAILECTSEGILQHRHRFIKFEAMAFTNLYREHLERHKGFENYKKAKAEYFKNYKATHIINIDDNNAEYFLKFGSKKKIIYGINIDSAKIKNYKSIKIIKAENIELREKSALFQVNGLQFSVPLIGEFNVYNALCAICVGIFCGLSLKQCASALGTAKVVPGRMQEIISAPFKVFVDYAFTPDALEKAYQTFGRAKLICILGACGGGRDKWKRKELGRIARRYCEEVIITNEDPYDEDPIDIIQQVADGAGKRAIKILDRRQAIRTALELAKNDNIVIITGKGSEPWICVANGKKIPWNDAQVIKQEFEKIKMFKSRASKHI